ncbi:BnaC01g41960D [Brassica napus]|uniref:BnaC01g41960D protein n=1 Tax=Brassica napus TaxID=3708 RepID=A0A078IWC3_BRANA|nr:BnaC01g41960D [Brassica napus]
MQKLCPGWCYTSNHASDEDGRIIIIWQHPVSIQVLEQSRQTLTCTVSLPSSITFTFTVVYAANTEAERIELWVHLLNIQQTFSLLTSPWVVGGDFNQILHPSEHSSIRVNSLSASMIDFSDCLLQADLFDLRYQGVFHTWFNKQPASPITKKLDRLLVNQAWISYLPHSLATVLPPNISDHSPCSLDLALPLPIAGTKPFKFFNFLTLHPDFVQTVADFWIQAGGHATFLGDLCWKLSFSNLLHQSCFKKKKNFTRNGNF